MSRFSRLVNRPGPPLDQAVEWMLRLNQDAARAMVSAGASAATDITGYGLVGHLLEMTSGSGTGAVIHLESVPVLEGAREWRDKGFVPQGTKRNVDGFQDRVKRQVSDPEFQLLCDAQTSGGLLIAIAPERRRALEDAFSSRGVFYQQIGEMTAAEKGISIVP